MGTTHVQDFASFSDLLEFATDPGKCWGSSRDSRDKSSFYADFCGTPNFDAAVELARFGWHDGLTRLSAAMDIIASAAHLDPLPFVAMDVAGAFPIVPVAVAGDPLNMVHLAPSEDRVKPVLRLAYNTGALAKYAAHELTNAGAAFLSVVAGLEGNGFRVEVTMCPTSEGNGGKYAKAMARTVIKRADEGLELDRLAFCLLHASCHRRINFSRIERHPELEQGWASSYGRTCHPDKEHLDPGQAYIGGVQSFKEGSKELRTPEAAYRAFKPLILQALREAGYNVPTE